MTDLPVVSISAPKTGSHMLGFGLGVPTGLVYHEAASGQKGMYRSISEQVDTINRWKKAGLWAHIGYSQSTYDTLKDKFEAIFFIRRDPRDVVVSLSYYLEKFPNASTDMVAPDGKTISNWDHNNRMMWLITQMGLFLPHFTGWIRDGVYQVRYEDMIDDREGEFAKIEEHLRELGLDPPDGNTMAEMSKVKHHLSFRRGKRGDWRDEFRDRHKDWSDKYLKHVIQDWGYPQGR